MNKIKVFQAKSITSMLLAALAITSCVNPAGAVKVTGSVAAGLSPFIGNPVKYAIFTFPTRTPLAEILYALPAAPKNGQPRIKWGRVLAQGQLRLPTNSELQVSLRFDGLDHMDQLVQLQQCRVGSFDASELDFEDRHMHYLRDFKALRVLDLRDTLITDKSLIDIGALPELSIINLVKTNVTGSGFDSLKNLRKVREITVEGTSLKPGNIFKLKPLMPGLLSFTLTRTSLSKADAAILKDLKAVRTLSLGANSNIDNDCVKYLSNLKDLIILNIEDTSITDKSIPALLKLPNLRQVKVRDSAFWTAKNHKTRYGNVAFEDIERFSDAPAEVFTPLH